MKVFNLGLPRSGTKTVATILHKAGLKVCHDPIGSLEKYPEDKEPLRKLLKKVDSIAGGLSPIYIDLYKDYPHSKYILVKRKKEDWLDSCSRVFGKSSPIPYRLRVFGAERYSKGLFSSLYDTYHKECQEFFVDKLNFLLIDLYCKDLSRTICSFLGKPYSGWKEPWIKSKADAEWII